MYQFLRLDVQPIYKICMHFFLGKDYRTLWEKKKGVESKPLELEDSWTSGKQIEETPVLAPPYGLKQDLVELKIQYRIQFEIFES